MKVHLAVRYMAAEEYVRQYADNLSQGGLFIAGASELDQYDVVIVEIDLPGFGTFKVEAEVMHATTYEQAQAAGSQPGAGLKILSGPRGFQKALAAYLMRLGKRHDVTVFVASDGIGRVLKTAGYYIQSTPSTQSILEAVQNSDKPPVAVVVPASRVEMYKAALAGGMLDDLVLGMGGAEEVNNVLAILDRRIITLPS